MKRYVWALTIVLAGCGARTTQGQAARTAAERELADRPDASPIPPPPTKKGIIVPSDTPIGVDPPGSSTGTSGASLGPKMGGTPGAN